MKKSIVCTLLLLLITIVANAQNVTVQGVVVSATDSEPLIGASVISEIQGSVGVSTDLDGKFTLTVPEGTKLMVSYVGFKSKTVVAEDQMTIALAEDS